VRKKKVESARVLLELGSNVNGTNDADLKPLHLAVKSCCEDDMIDLLVRFCTQSCKQPFFATSFSSAECAAMPCVFLVLRLDF
jgi:hypothetical protein